MMMVDGTAPAEVRVWQGRLPPPELVQGLAAVLVDCVEGGASVHFLAGLEVAEAAAYWDGVLPDVAAGDVALVTATAADGTLVGTVHVRFARQPNQPHRGELCKLLVTRAARRTGLGERLVRTAEQAALAAGRWLLILDTEVGSDAERLYRRLGWQVSGTIPDYALTTDGRLAAAALYWKRLGTGVE